MATNKGGTPHNPARARVVGLKPENQGMKDPGGEKLFHNVTPTRFGFKLPPESRGPLNGRAVRAHKKALQNEEESC